ncbi:MAG: RHS repeat-associated core domain-containing protein [Candidatus Electrothrix sp. AUS1_2]|nr:RHS repeat-associated core domain-containing protein [Candidatus Electrothrix sp. AUS1_2]
MAVYDGSDSLLMRFEYADGRMPIAMTAGGATYYLGYDQVGSLRTVADASGNVVKEISYDSFGTILSDSNPAFAVPFGFAGGLHDRDTGLVKFGFRDYDPAIGRWVAKDPIFFAGGDVDLYGYVLNDPISFVDPEGLIIPAILGAAVINGGINVLANINNIESIGDFGRAFAAGAIPALAAPLSIIPVVGPALAGGLMGMGTNYLNVRWGVVKCKTKAVEDDYIARGLIAGVLGGAMGGGARYLADQPRNIMLPTAIEAAANGVSNGLYSLKGFYDDLP